MNRHIGLIILLAALPLVYGCASCRSSHAADRDLAGLRAIAVADIRGDIESETARDQIGHFFAVELLGKGYNLVERRNVKAVLEEQDFQFSDLTERRGMAEAGRILNVDAILSATVTTSGERMAVSAEVITVGEGRVVWAAHTSGSSRKTLLTVIGAGIGGALGWIFGGEEDDRVAGGAAGGAAGGLIARELTPDEQKLASRLIRRLCGTFPQRPVFE